MRKWLIDIRKKKGLSQKSVCEAVDIAQPTYWEYEHGECTPTVPIAKKVAALLGFDWTRFYDDQPINKEEKAV